MAELQNGIVKKVRSVIEKHREFGPEYLLDCGDPEQVRGAIRWLKKRGEVKTLYRGRHESRYRYLGTPQRKQQPEKLRRILRAMHVKGAFSAADVAMLADASVNYAEKTARYLLGKGHLDVAGHGKNHRGARVRVYRVRHRDRFQTEVVGRDFAVIDITAPGVLKNKGKKSPLPPFAKGGKEEVGNVAECV